MLQSNETICTIRHALKSKTENGTAAGAVVSMATSPELAMMAVSPAWSSADGSDTAFEVVDGSFEVVDGSFTAVSSAGAMLAAPTSAAFGSSSPRSCKAVSPQAASTLVTADTSPSLAVVLHKLSVLLHALALPCRSVDTTMSAS